MLTEFGRDTRSLTRDPLSPMAYMYIYVLYICVYLSYVVGSILKGDLVKVWFGLVW